MRSNYGGGCYGKPHRFEIIPEGDKEPVILTGAIAFETHSAMMQVPRGPERVQFLREQYDGFNSAGEVEGATVESESGGVSSNSGAGSVGSGGDGEHGLSPITRDLPSDSELAGDRQHAQAQTTTITCPNCGSGLILKGWLME